MNILIALILGIVTTITGYQVVFNDTQEPTLGATIQSLPGFVPTTTANGITQRIPNKPIVISGLDDGCLELVNNIATTTTGLPCGSGGSGGGSGLSTSSIDTEAELESILVDVTNVFTNNDGSLNQDNLSDNTTSDLSEGSNLYYTLARVQTALTGGYNAIFGNSTSTKLAITNTLSFDSVVGTSWSDFCLSITGAAGLCDGVDDAGGGGYSDELAQDAVGTILATSTTIQWNYNDATPFITAEVVPNSISLSNVDSGITTSLGRADTALQSSDINVSIQGYDTNLATFAGISGSDGDLLTWQGGDWTVIDLASLKTALAIVAADISDFVDNVRTSISETITGINYNNTTGVFGLDAGREITLTASSTNWNGFYNTPSTRITAGDALTWSGNTMNFDGGNTPGGELGGTWASPTLDDSVAVTSWNLTSPTLTTFFGTPCTGNQFLQDISDTGAFTCVTAAGGSGSGLSTTTPWTVGNLAYVASNSAVGSVATGTLTESVSGLEFSATRALIGGSSALSLSTGFNIPLTASTTNWNTFYNTPSNRITANDGLTWSGNNLNFDGGNAPLGELGGTWASPTIDDSIAVTGWNLTTPTITTSGTFFADTIDDFTGFGLSLSSGDLGILTTGATDGECLVYESTGPTIDWVTCGGGGGGSSLFTDAGAFTYLTATTDDVVFGRSATTTAPFWWDVSATTTYIGNGGGYNSVTQYGSNSTAWAIGQDVAASNAFKISSSTNLGTTDFLTILKTGLVRVDKAFQVVGQFFDSLTLAGELGDKLISTGSGTEWVNHRDYVEYFEDFLFETLTTVGSSGYGETISGTSAACTNTQMNVANRPGMSRCTTGTTATGRFQMATGNTAIALGSGTTTVEGNVRINALSTVTDRYQMAFGFIDNASAVNHTDGAYILYDEGGVTTGSAASANWQCVTANNTTRTFTTSGTAVNTTDNSRLTVEVNPAGTSVKFYVGDTNICTHTTNIPTGISRVVGSGFQVNKSIGTTARTFDLDYIWTRINFTTQR